MQDCNIVVWEYLIAWKSSFLFQPSDVHMEIAEFLYQLKYIPIIPLDIPIFSGHMTLYLWTYFSINRDSHCDDIKCIRYFACPVYRVEYILNVTREIDNFFPGMFEYYNVRLWDEEASELLKHWDDTYKFIAKAKYACQTLHKYLHSTAYFIFSV